MRAIWKGSVTFGLVNIPVALYPAVKKEAIKFRLLRKSDHSPIGYQRVAEADGKEVPWEQVEKGYEYEKGKFVSLSESEIKEVGKEAGQTIQIVNFVELSQIDPVYFDTPYYLEPQKSAGKAYGLLRQILMQTGKIGIAKVVIRTREHLAALKPNGDFLLLQLMHFAEEIVPTEGLNRPGEEKLDKRELEMARTLLESMTDKWDPAKYKNDYNIALWQMIEKKIKAGGKVAKGRTVSKASPGSNVVNLLDILQKSLEEAKPASRKKKAAG
jgi:DNA end-binding protein Ku